MPAAGSAIVAGVSALATSATFVAIAKTVAVQVFLSVVARKLAGNPGSARNSAPRLRSVQINSRDATTARQFVYGEVVKGGQIVFQDTASTGNFLLWTVIALAGHEIEEISEVIIDGVVIDLSADLDGNGDCTLSDFIDEDGNKLLRVKSYLGTSTQTADADMLNDFTTPVWDTDHRLRGIPYIALRMESDTSDMSQAASSAKRVWSEGFPQSIRARVKGKKVYDPREVGHDPDDASTWEWSDNAALCVADYLRDSRMGLGAGSARIEETILASSANTCDENVDVWAGTGDGVTETTQKRYTCNGVVSSDQTPSSIVETLLASMIGTVTESAGKLEIFPGRYDAPVFSFGDDDFAGPIRFSKASSKRDRWNYVRGQFMDEARDWQPAEFSPRSNATYETDDGGRLPRDLVLQMVTNEQRAQWLAAIYLNTSRLVSVAEFVLKADAVGVKRNDVIQVSNSELGWTNKLFRVTEWEIVPSTAEGSIAGFSIRLGCRAESATAYTIDNATDLTDIAQPGVLPVADNEPRAVTTAEALGVIAGIRVEFFSVWQSGVEAIEIWRSATNNRAVAERRATVSQGSSQFLDEYTDFKSSPPVSMRGGETYFYWLKVRKSDGVASEWFPVSATAGLEGTSEQTTEITEDSQGGAVALTTTWTSYAGVTLTMFSGDSTVNAEGEFNVVSGIGAPTQTVQFRLIRDPGGANEKTLKTSEFNIAAEQIRTASISGVDIRSGDTVFVYDYDLQIRSTSGVNPPTLFGRSIVTQQLR